MSVCIGMDYNSFSTNLCTFLLVQLHQIFYQFISDPIIQLLSSYELIEILKDSQDEFVLLNLVSISRAKYFYGTYLHENFGIGPDIVNFMW